MYNEKTINNNTNIPVEILDEIDSTNEEAKRRIKEGCNKDFVLVARKQTKGKGRKGRSFYSPKDTGIYFTFAHFSDSELSNDLKVTVATSVITSKAIKESLGIDCKIKWVNDLYYQNKKVSGTLCEGILKGIYGNDKNVIIVGIGINISTEEFPSDISLKAGSVLNGEKKNLSDDYKDNIVIYLTNGLESFFDNPDLKGYMSYYNEASLILNKEVELSDASGMVDKGQVFGFDENGSILIKDAGGIINKYDSGEISLFML